MDFSHSGGCGSGQSGLVPDPYSRQHPSWFSDQAAVTPQHGLPSTYPGPDSYYSGSFPLPSTSGQGACPFTSGLNQNPQGQAPNPSGASPTGSISNHSGSLPYPPRSISHSTRVIPHTAGLTYPEGTHQRPRVPRREGFPQATGVQCSPNQYQGQGLLVSQAGPQPGQAISSVQNSGLQSSPELHQAPGCNTRLHHHSPSTCRGINPSPTGGYHHPYGSNHHPVTTTTNDNFTNPDGPGTVTSTSTVEGGRSLQTPLLDNIDNSRQLCYSPPNSSGSLHSPRKQFGLAELQRPGALYADPQPGPSTSFQGAGGMPGGQGGGPPPLQPLIPGALAEDKVKGVVHWTTDGRPYYPLANSHQSSSDEDQYVGGLPLDPADSMPQRERLNYTKQQLHVLNIIFMRVPYPNKNQKFLIARRMGITKDQVKIWFQNRRRKNVIAQQKEAAGQGASTSTTTNNNNNSNNSNDNATASNVDDDSTSESTASRVDNSSCTEPSNADGQPSAPKKPRQEMTSGGQGSSGVEAPSTSRGEPSSLPSSSGRNVSQRGSGSLQPDVTTDQVIRSLVAEVERLSDMGNSQDRKKQRRQRAAKQKAEAAKAKAAAAAAAAAVAASNHARQVLSQGVHLFKKYDMVSPPNMVIPSGSGGPSTSTASRFSHSSHSSAFQDPKAGTSGLGGGAGTMGHGMGSQSLLRGVDPMQLVSPYSTSPLGSLHGDLFHQNFGSGRMPSPAFQNYPALSDSLNARGGMDMSPGRGGPYGSSYPSSLPPAAPLPSPQQYPSFSGQDPFFSGMLGSPSRMFPGPFVADAPVMLSSLRHPAHPALPGTSSQDPYQSLIITSYHNPYFPETHLPAPSHTLPSTSSSPGGSWPGPPGGGSFTRL